MKYERKQNIPRQRLEFSSGIGQGRHTHPDDRLRGEHTPKSVDAAEHIARRAYPPLRLRLPRAAVRVRDYGHLHADTVA